MTVRLKQPEKMEIVNQAVVKVEQEGQELYQAVEEAIVEQVPRAMVEVDGEVQMGVSTNVVEELAMIVEQRLYGEEESGVQGYNSMEEAEQAERQRRQEQQEQPEQEELPKCLCGCGLPVNHKRSKFRQGHDAKLNSILLKVEREELTEDDIPEEARNVMVPCECCGKLILPHESGKGPLCRAGSCKCVKA